MPPLPVLAKVNVDPCFSGQSAFSTASQSLVVRTSTSRAQRHFQSARRSHLLRDNTLCQAASSSSSDPFVAAGSRLETLLSGLGDGEEEILGSLLSDSAPQLKLVLSLLAGGIITSGALALCWLTGSDPWGGASLSPHSLISATLGAAASAPFLMLRASMWTKEAHRRFPVLEELQRRQAESYSPVVQNMSAAQMAMLVWCEVVPTTLMTLPAAQGGLTVSFQIYADHMREWGLSVPGIGPPAAALGVTALLAACARLLEHAVTEEEHDVVATAISNADRYYRVMANGPSRTPQDPQSASTAFKAVASQWLQHRQHASTVLATMTAGEVAFLGLLWRMTGDMAAPISAAMLLTAVEYAFVKKLADSKSPSSR